MRCIAASLLGVVVGLATPLTHSAAEAADGSSAASSPVMERIKAQGFVRCGTDQTPGFGGNDAEGRPVGFDSDFCRALAAAVLGDPNAVRTARVSTAHKFTALRDGDLDVTFGMTTWTFDRDTRLGATFPAVTFHDGQGFMVWRDSGITRAADITTGAVCVQRGTTSEANLRDYLRDRPGVEILLTGSTEDKLNGFAEGRCTVVTGDRSELAAQRSRRTAMPDAWVVLPDTISREPLGPAVTAADPHWAAVVRWVMLVPLIAEVRGVSQDTLTTVEAADQELRNLLGQTEDFGASLGLEPDWARRVVEAVGNYGEIFDRNLAPLDLDRGANALWRDGGLFHPPPLR